MREATGGALLINIIIIFIVIFIALLSSSVNYSKAFKVKDNIIGMIEDHKGFDDATKNEVSAYLKEVGYNVSTTDNKCAAHCSNKGTSGVKCRAIDHRDGYRYCVLEYQESGNRKYYQVIAYMTFDIPVINEIIHIPVYGETKTFRN